MPRVNFEVINNNHFYSQFFKYTYLIYQSLLHSALGAEIVDFMKGKETAAAALADVEAAYSAAAREKGFLK